MRARTTAAAALLTAALAGCGSGSATTTARDAGAGPTSSPTATSTPGEVTPSPTASTEATPASTPSVAAVAAGDNPHVFTVAGGWAVPDPALTPGAVLTADTAKVCTSGYSATVRDVGTAEKNAVYAEYGITHHVSYQYEIDHDISLELGGSNDITNLWPEPNDKPTGNTKDALENKLHELVCAGSLQLTDAQAAIRGDWTVAYRKYVGPLGTYRSNGLGSASTPPPAEPATVPAPDVYFANCTQAKAAGAAPLHRGDPGYRAALDRDGDGVACE